MLISLTVNSEMQMHDVDVVAFVEKIPATHFSMVAPLPLRRGQMGAVVMTYDGSAFEVEFCGTQGSAFAMLPIPADRAILLHDAPLADAA